jgi:hypothetical protein
MDEEDEETPLVEEILAPISQNVEQYVHFSGLDEMTIIKKFELEIKELKPASLEDGRYVYTQWKPTSCPGNHDADCTMQLYGFQERHRYYDVTLPGILMVPKFHCKSHNATYSAIQFVEVLPDKQQ